jgi:hypothetical protein
MVEAAEVAESGRSTEETSPWQLCVAPMMDWIEIA